MVHGFQVWSTQYYEKWIVSLFCWFRFVPLWFVQTKNSKSWFYFVSIRFNSIQCKCKCKCNTIPSIFDVNLKWRQVAWLDNANWIVRFFSCLFLSPFIFVSRHRTCQFERGVHIVERITSEIGLWIAHTHTHTMIIGMIQAGPMKNEKKTKS